MVCSSAAINSTGRAAGLAAGALAMISPPPTLGQHTGEVLSEVLGLSEAEIARLREQRVI